MAQLKQISMGVTPNYAPKQTVGEGLANLLISSVDAATGIMKEKKRVQLEEEEKNKEVSLIAMNDYKLKLKDYKTKNNFDNQTSDNQSAMLDEFKNSNYELYNNMIKLHQQSTDDTLLSNYDVVNQTRNLENEKLGNEVINSFVSGSDRSTNSEHIDQVLESVSPLFKEGYDTTKLRETIQKGIVENQYSDIVKDSVSMSDEELKSKYTVYGSVTNRNITDSLNSDIKKARLDFNINSATLQGYSKSYIMAKYPSAKPSDIDNAINTSVAKLLATNQYKSAIQLAGMHNVKIDELESLYSRMNGFKGSDAKEVARIYDVYNNTKHMYMQDEKNAIKLDAIQIAADIAGISITNKDGTTNGQGVADALKIVEERKNETSARISQEDIQDVAVDGWKFWQNNATDGEKNLVIEYANAYMRYTVNDKEAALEYAMKKVKDMRGVDRSGLSKVTTDANEIDGLKRHFSPQGDDSGVEITYLYNDTYTIRTEDGEGNTKAQIYTKQELKDTLVQVAKIETAKQSISNIALQDPNALRSYGNSFGRKTMVADSVKIKKFIEDEASKYAKEKGLKLSEKEKTLLIPIIKEKLKKQIDNAPTKYGNKTTSNKQTTIQDIVSESYDEFVGLEEMNINNQEVKSSIVQRKSKEKNPEYISVMKDDIKRSTAQNVSDIVENAHNKILTSSVEEMSDNEIEQFMETASGKMFKFINTDKEAFEKKIYRQAESSNNDLVEENLFRIEKDLQQVVGKERANALLKSIKKYKDELIDYVKTNSGSLDDGSN